MRVLHTSQLAAGSLIEIAPGGLKYVEVHGTEILLGNYEGKIYAVERRCGHMNAPLELGTLKGVRSDLPDALRSV